MRTAKVIRWKLFSGSKSNKVQHVRMRCLLKMYSLNSVYSNTSFIFHVLTLNMSLTIGSTQFHLIDKRFVRTETSFDRHFLMKVSVEFNEEKVERIRLYENDITMAGTQGQWVFLDEAYHFNKTQRQDIVVKLSGYVKTCSRSILIRWSWTLNS